MGTAEAPSPPCPCNHIIKHPQDVDAELTASTGLGCPASWTGLPDQAWPAGPAAGSFLPPWGSCLSLGGAAVGPAPASAQPPCGQPKSNVGGCSGLASQARGPWWAGSGLEGLLGCIPGCPHLPRAPWEPRQILQHSSEGRVKVTAQAAARQKWHRAVILAGLAVLTWASLFSSSAPWRGLQRWV